MRETRGPPPKQSKTSSPHAASHSCRITREEDGGADHAYPRRTAAGGEGRHRSTHSSMATSEVHQATAKQPCRPASTTGASSPPMMRRRGSPLLPIVVRRKGRRHRHRSRQQRWPEGRRLEGRLLGFGEGSSAAAREGGGRGGRVGEDVSPPAEPDPRLVQLLCWYGQILVLD